jgi:putative DNA primase/helicase
MNKIEYAIEYAKNFGYSVVPANSEQKKGSYVKWKKYQDRVADEVQIVQWFEDYPEAGIAVVTGKISNILVLDIDPRHGGMETIKENNLQLPVTVSVNTGGGGYHYYYKYPQKLSEKLGGKIKNFTGDNVGLPGLDLRADGGFVYAPPSIHPSGQKYQFAEGISPAEVALAEPPEWLIEVIKDRQQAEQKKSTDWEKKWAGSKEGNRNNSTAQLAGKLAHSEVPPETAKEILLEKWNSKNRAVNGAQNPLPAEEVIKTIDNIYNIHAESKELDKFQPKRLAEMVFQYLKNEKREVWLYVAEMETFYVYRMDEGYWQKDNEEYLKASIRSLLVQIKKQWENKKNISEVLESYRHSVQKKEYFDKFNEISQQDKEYINVKNGLLFWEDEELLDHHSHLFSTHQLKAEYDPDAECPNWEKALAEWVPDQNTRDFLQEYIGYTLIPDTSQQVALFLTGGGSNGKSTFLEVITEMFGSNSISNIPLQRLSERFEVAKIQHKLVNICSDIDPTYLKKTGVLKTMIPGEPLRGEEKFKASFDFRPYVRLIFSANELPSTKDHSEGWYRRLKIVRFPNSFKKSDSNYDPHLKEKLIDEIDGIFLWALEGLQRLSKNSRFTNSQEMQKAKNQYKRENDSVKAFEDDCVQRMDEDKTLYTITKGNLYHKYRVYAEESGLKPVSRKKFSRQFKELGYEEARRRRTGSVLEEYDFLNVEDSESRSTKPKRCFIKIKVTTR